MFWLKSLSRNSFGGLFYSFPAAYLNVDWPNANFVLGKWIFLPSLRALPRTSDLKFIYLCSCLRQRTAFTILKTNCRRNCRCLLNNVKSPSLSLISCVQVRCFVLQVKFICNLSKKSYQTVFEILSNHF